MESYSFVLLRRLVLPLALLGICLVAFAISFTGARLLEASEEVEVIRDRTAADEITDDRPEVRSWLDPDPPVPADVTLVETEGPEILDPCEADDVGEEYGQVLVVYRVLDSRLADVCYGEANPIVESSWDALLEFTDEQSRSSLSLFAGIESFSVLAFAGPVSDFSFDDFVIAVDVFAARVDTEELRLTLAHELGHVLTQEEGQLDENGSRRNCESFHNGYSCFLRTSYLGAWTEQFWSEEALADLPRIGFDDQEEGYERCLADRTFLGSYAATHPEEDFAESFSAFVFSVAVPEAVQPRIDFFMSYPELVAFRDRAQAAGQADLSSNFDLCG